MTYSDESPVQGEMVFVFVNAENAPAAVGYPG